MTHIERAKENVGVQLLSALVDEWRAAPDVWQKLSEEQQREAIDRMAHRVEHEVGQAIAEIQCGDFARVRASVESVTFKDDVKVTLKLSRTDPQVHDLADRQGDTVLVVIADPNQFLQSLDKAVKPDADEPQLPFGAPATPPDGDGMPSRELEQDADTGIFDVGDPEPQPEETRL